MGGTAEFGWGLYGPRGKGTLVVVVSESCPLGYTVDPASRIPESHLRSADPGWNFGILAGGMFLSV